MTDKSCLWLRPSDDQSGKIIIELNGTAGCGKSFVMEAVRKATGGQRYTPKVKSTDYLFLILILPSLIFIRRDWGIVFRRAAKKVLLFRSLARETSGVYLLDQGPWHFFCATYAPRAWPLRVDMLLYACMPFLPLKMPDHVIFLRVSPETLIARRIGRNRKNEKSIEPEEVSRSCELVNRLTTLLESRFSATVKTRTIDNDADDTAGDILRQIVEVAGASVRADVSV